MKTLYFTQRKGCAYYANPILVDTVNNKFSIKESMPDSINDMYIADEPVEIRYEHNGKTYLKKADKGDIIISFYTRSDYDRTPIIVVKNDDWKNNIVNQLAASEANKAKDTLKASYDTKLSECNGCCNNCDC